MLRSILWRYGVVATAVGLVLALKGPLESLVGAGPPLILFLPAITFGAWFGGFGTGIFATGLAVLACNYLFFPPIGSLWVQSPNDLMQLGIFLAEGTLTSILMQQLIDARRLSEASAAAAEGARRRALQAERLAAIGQMVTGLAHESRNALQRSQACLEMLVRRVGGRPEALDLIAGIQEAQDDLHRLYEEVRNYAAPILLDRRPCPLGEVLREAWERLEPQRKGRDVRLREGGLPAPRCPADRFRLAQVFRNILDNAIAACHDPVRIDVNWAAATLDGGPAVRVAFRDNGPGLSLEQRARLFEPFYTTKTQGTGLGMAIAKRIVEAHGGTIAAEDGGGPGGRIVITLPGEVA